jgi:transmembrane protein EpsG
LSGNPGDWQRLEAGFQLIFKLSALLYEDSRLFFIFSSFIITFFLFESFYRYSSSALLCVFLFVSLYYYFNSLNGIRQFTAMSMIMFFSTKYLVERSLLKYLVSVLMASLFHVSALVMLPAYWLCKKLSFKMIVLLLIFLPIFFLMYDSFSGFIFNIIPNYSVYSEYKVGSASAFILVQFLFLCVVLFSYYNNNNWTNVELVSLNLSIISIFLLVLSYNNSMFIRLGMFYGMYTMLLFPAALGSFKGGINKLILYIAFIVFGLVNLGYHLYQNVSDVLPFTFQ